jgi:acyl dehydratase
LLAAPELPVDSDPQTTDQDSVRVEIPLAMAHVYSECAQIWNPIHTEKRVAIAAGLPDIILHGTATWAIAGREIVGRYLAGDWGQLSRLHGRFTGMVMLGSALEVRMYLDHPAGCVFFSVWNDAGERVISQGVASLR